jgi:hypothetical protein
MKATDDTYRKRSLDELGVEALAILQRQPGLRCGALGEALFREATHRGSAPFARLAGRVMKKLERRGLAEERSDGNGWSGWHAIEDASDAICDRLDPIVWAAHFVCRLIPTAEADFYFAIAVDRSDWRHYWSVTRAECHGCWHGATGRIAERLGLIDEADASVEWKAMVRLQSPEPAKSLGDSSHDYSHIIERSVTLLEG